MATTTRPEFAPLGIAKDMVMPIAPNADYLKDRDPITPSPTFPFKNCFFWYNSRLTIRVRRSPDWYNPQDGTAELSVEDCAKLGSIWRTDFPRLDEAMKGLSEEEIEALEERASHTVCPPLPYSPAETCLEVIPACDSPGVLGMDYEPMAYPESNSEEACGETSSFVGSLSSFVGDVFATNVFGWEADPASKFLPLVDMWLELNKHLSDDTIPSPTDLYNEQRAIQR